MKKFLAPLFALSFSLVACGTSETSEVKKSSLNPEAKEEIKISLEEPTAGLDYPTDAPIFASLKGKKILQINMKRIVVPATVKLEKAKAGIDYPTDVAVSVTPNAKLLVLVLEENVRLPLALEKPAAGIDVPTDTPIPASLGLVWYMGNDQRVFVNSIKSIEKAVAGLDFPTDGPGRLDRDFWVYTSQDEEFNIHRTAIRVTRSN